MALTNAERQQRFRQRHGFMRAGVNAPVDPVSTEPDRNIEAEFVELIKNHWEVGARRELDEFLANAGLGDRIAATHLAPRIEASRPTALDLLVIAETGGVEWARREIERLCDERRYKATLSAAAEHASKTRQPRRAKI